MSYKVGKRAVIPYGDYMKRHKISREEAEEAAAKYGMHIDPVQFECKKRGRPTTTLAHMITPTQDLPPAPEQEEATVEQPWPWPKPVEATPIQAAAEEETKIETKVPETKVPETKPKETKVPETKTETKTKVPETKTKAESTKKANLEEGELEEESVFDDNVEDSDEEDDEEEFTAEKIENLVIADLRRLAESRGIATKENGKSIPIKTLRQIVLRKLNLAE
jgi:hypothetical protein